MRQCNRYTPDWLNIHYKTPTLRSAACTKNTEASSLSTFHYCTLQLYNCIALGTSPMTLYIRYMCRR